MVSLEEEIRTAKEASIRLSALDTVSKDSALKAMAEALDTYRDAVISANQDDMTRAEEMEANGELSNSLVKRLIVTDEKINSMIANIEGVIRLKDPVGETMSAMKLDDELILYQVRCPIGMIGVIFESRPDVVPQIMSLCLKSGNSVVFKGGREATDTNRALFNILSQAAYSAGVPKGVFCLMETREDVNSVLKMDRYIDLLIPRGSNEFVRYIQNNTRIPVLGHAAGICHVYVDGDADMKKALDVSLDAKVQYPAVCNAMETLIVDRNIAGKFLPKIVSSYVENGVEIRADKNCMKILSKINSDKISEAKDADWDEEYNDLIVSIKMVDSADEAIDFINKHGSGHTDSIVTENKQTALKFVNMVDSSSVFVNVSTRFSDGFIYGKGAEVGISTNKIHSRGPVGMEGLMIYKYILVGEGQTVKDYVGKSARKFKHDLLQKEFEL